MRAACTAPSRSSNSLMIKGFACLRTSCDQIRHDPSPHATATSPLGHTAMPKISERCPMVCKSRRSRTDQAFSTPSSPPVRSSPRDALKATAYKYCEEAFTSPTLSPAAVHVLSMPSLPTLAKESLPVEHMDRTGAPKGPTVRTHTPSAVRHKRIVPSPEPEASSFRRLHTEFTAMSWPTNVKQLPSSCHKRAVLSHPEDMMSPVAVNATDEMLSTLVPSEWAPVP
mmetsp:Transcript_43550/g.114975  ORF Transcript_43550/g.114975 Transcript_43550/m.114975 type:complete len:226 (-) Transcript_43550:678-1355(-)